jgi:hypothetical protein
MAAPSVGRLPRLLLVLALAAGSRTLASAASAQHEGPAARYEVASSHPLPIGGSILQVDFAVGPLDLPLGVVLAYVRAAASAVTGYYGKFPVPRARILIVPVAGRAGILQGTTWGDMGGFPAFTRIRLGEHTTAADLADDWMTTHELVHMAFPSMPDDQHWIEEGQATYIEPIARVATGELDARKVWGDMFRDMTKGEPQPNDLGLDHTHTWARTYWGGALFCLLADVAIRRETHNRKGLQDALRAVVAQGGTIDHDWPLSQALAIGDHATGTHVLTRMYSEWKDKPVPVDLSHLWDELGIRAVGDGIEFNPSAPLAAIRTSIAADHTTK